MLSTILTLFRSVSDDPFGASDEIEIVIDDDFHEAIRPLADSAEPQEPSPSAPAEVPPFFRSSVFDQYLTDISNDAAPSEFLSNLARAALAAQRNGSTEGESSDSPRPTTPRPRTLAPSPDIVGMPPLDLGQAATAATVAPESNLDPLTESRFQPSSPSNPITGVTRALSNTNLHDEAAIPTPVAAPIFSIDDIEILTLPAWLEDAFAMFRREFRGEVEDALLLDWIALECELEGIPVRTFNPGIICTI